jgi:phage/plasmid-like protein (TIGR03299 family)
MAHDINFNDQTGKHSFFSVKEKAWHGLGQVISDYPTSAEAIKHACLDYHVEKRPLFTYDTDNHNGDPDTDIIIPEIEVPNFFATVRTDTEQVLGVVGNDYQILQNVNAFTFFDAIVGGKDGILYETAGALSSGSKVFITAKLPDYIRVGRNDCVEKYLFLSTSHDGLGSIQIAFTPIRVVCANTLNSALRNQVNGIKIRHTASATDKLKEAHKMLGISNSLAEELEAIYNRWSRVRITDREVKRLIQLAMAPSKEVLINVQKGADDELSSHFNNLVDNVFQYAMISPTQQEETTKGTVFGAYNGVTGYFQNARNFKSDEAKFKSIMYGTGLQRSQSAFDLCHEFTQHGSSALLFN